MAHTEKHLFELIMDIRKKCLRTEEKIRKKLSLTLGELNGLIVLEGGESITSLAFSSRLNLSPSRGSRVLGNLKDKEYVELEIQSADRRAVNAYLTPSGERMREKIYKEMSECEKRITSQLSEKQLKNIREALILLSETM